MKLIWLPYKKKAAFTITDDTDKASLRTVRAVYNLMTQLGIRTTKTVWPFKPAALSGIPPQPNYWSSTVTLQDKEYLEYCRWLSNNGFEICLHGASCGNNIRGRTLNATQRMKEEGFSTRTYICHSKNAENPYWERKITSSRILRKLLSLFLKYETYGETDKSEYFWGDICKEHINYIRFFRTRKTNTLNANPSMPYHSLDKPFVNYWFSATKRSLSYCTSDEVLDSLVSEKGVTILYQYMHRYADDETGKVSDKCISSLRRLSNRKDIWIDNVSNILDRLKAFQMLCIVKYRHKYYIVNTSKEDIYDIQISFDIKNTLKNIAEEGVLSKYARLRLLKGKCVLPIELVHKEDAQDSCKTTEVLPGILLVEKPFAKIFINLSNDWKHIDIQVLKKDQKIEAESTSNNISIGPLKSITIYRNKEAERLEMLSTIGKAEEAGLYLAQARIIFRENMYSKRDWYMKILRSRDKYAYHDNW